SLNEHTSDMIQLRRAFLIALPGALLVVALGAAFVGWRVLTPIEALGRDMDRVSAEALDRRIDAAGADREFEPIIRNYNSMLERLERSFHQANRFSADVSHELKTPLAIMQGSLERALSQCEGSSVAQKSLSEVLEQTGHQRSILESLLLLSRADSGKLHISREPIDLSEKLKTWVEDAEFLAEPHGITVESDIQPNLWIEGDSIMLQQVAHNLFSNAARYNITGGEILCRLRSSGDHIEWRVASTGKIIAGDDRERIFERFARADSTSKEPGAGLGLSLAQEIVLAHGGDIRLLDAVDGMNVFQVCLESAVHISKE
ncbi:MAG: ATP-binding protein, partial [Verrucomicrobiota bacterium]